MKKILKFLGILILVILLAAAGWFIYFNSNFPVKIEAENVKVESTPQRIDRGRYLACNVLGCIDCHSKRDFKFFGGPIVEGTEGMGGMMFNTEIANVPGTIYAKNITPQGIGDWTDGELIRVMRTGINKKGEALFPLMPYMHYVNLSQEDIYSVVAFIRTLKPIKNEVPQRSLDFPMNLIVKTIPQPAPEYPSAPDTTNILEYGKYMTNATACIDCHTQMEKGQFLPGMDYAGGVRFSIPGLNQMHTANITPDNETGIGTWTEEMFLNKFRTNAQNASVVIPAGGKNTVMPWPQYGQLTNTDLKAIYAYLRTVKPVKNTVVKYP